MRLAILLLLGSVIAMPAASAAGSGPAPKPGRWQITHTILSIGAAPEDMPPAMAAKMQAAWKKQIGIPKTSFECVTPKEAASIMRGEDDDDCTDRHISFSGGKISGSQVCDGRKLSATGTYSDQAYDMVIKPDGGEGSSIRIQGKWVGPTCAAGE